MAPRGRRNEEILPKEEAKYKLEALKEAWIKWRAVTLGPKTKVKKLKKKEESDLSAVMN